VKKLNRKEYYIILALSVLSVIISTSAVTYILRNSNYSTGENEAFLQFPSGIPSVLGANMISPSQNLQQECKTISVTGLGTASAQADEATVILGVQTEGKTASEAGSFNAKLMSSVIDALKALGISEKDIKTVSYSVYPMYSKDDYNTIIGYRVVNMIAVKVTHMDLIGTVIDTAMENGANRIQGVSFGLSSERQEELRMQAYLMALKNAEDKASLIAENLHVTITGVHSVSEISYQPYKPYYDYRVTFAESTVSTPILEGKLTVSVTLRVVYLFE